MSSYYGVIFPEFWTGPTGRELRKHGKDAQLLGLYLATNRHANMLGLYRLMVDDIRHETGLSVLTIAKAFRAVASTEYARFDAQTSYVWVRSMARFRLALQAGEALASGDKRAKATNRLYRGIDPNPFLGIFFDVNHRILLLEQRRENVGVVVDLSNDHKMSPFPSPLEAPSKPVSVSVSGNSCQTSEEHLAPKTPAQPVKPAFEHYHQRFQDRYHGKPEYSGAKDGARMAKLLKAHGLEEVTRRIEAFFASPDRWIQQSGHTLDVFFASGTQTKLVAQMGTPGGGALSERTTKLAASSREFLGDRRPA